MNTEDAAGVMAFENYLHKGLNERQQKKLANLTDSYSYELPL